MPEAHLYVELITFTPQPEATIATAAKLCYSGDDLMAHREKTSGADNAQFLRKLVEIGHLSPVEHASFTFGVQGVSRALLAQLTRHRIASFSVQSQRYVGQSTEGMNYVIPPSIKALGDKAAAKFESQMMCLQIWYEEWQNMLGNGEKSREDARFVLPNAAETRLMVTMNARELLHFFGLRCCSRAQWEIRAMAWAMLGHCLRVAPDLFDEAGPSCCSSTCKEGKMSCKKQLEVNTLLNELHKFVQRKRGSEVQDDLFSKAISEWARVNTDK